MTRTLLETKQVIPEFLLQYVPEGEALENLKFEADSDWEDETGGIPDSNAGPAEDDSGPGGWGSGGGDSGAAPDAESSGWGAEPATQSTSNW